MDKELLFKPRIEEADVELPTVGLTVRVRGLTRIEAMQVQKATGDAAIERKMLSIAMVDPELTESEVGKWQKVAPAGELEPVTDKISHLSGLSEDSSKSAYKSDGEETGD